MSITNEEIQQALRIKKVINAFFEKTNSNKIEAKELMNDFIKAGIFKTNNQDGLPIRSFLRNLEKENHLHLIPQAFFEQKDQNKNWFFIKSNK